VGKIVAGIEGADWIIAGTGAPGAAVLFSAGASRVSLGGGAMFATPATLRRVAESIRATGDWGSLEDGKTPVGFAEAEAPFADG
jgi:hypothetical protein